MWARGDLLVLMAMRWELWSFSRWIKLSPYLACTLPQPPPFCLPSLTPGSCYLLVVFSHQWLFTSYSTALGYKHIQMAFWCQFQNIYTKTHVWIRFDGDKTFTPGFTQTIKGEKKTIQTVLRNIDFSLVVNYTNNWAVLIYEHIPTSSGVLKHFSGLIIPDVSIWKHNVTHRVFPM